MIGRTLGPFLDWYAGQRRRQIERAWQNAAAVQAHTLLRLVETARRTEFGMIHGFDRIRTVADYQARVPVGTYLDFQPMWTRVLQGESDVTWPGRARHWVKTSGTTAGDKVIPVTREAFVSHRKGGWDAFLLAVRRVGARHLLDGRMLLVGGSTALHPVGHDGLLGDLSGLVVKGLPPVFRGRHSPGPTVAAIEDWEMRMSAVAALAARQDLRLLSGMPSWVLILLERVARVLEMSGRRVQDLGDCWPNLGVFVHGWVSFAPYEALFRERIGRPSTRSRCTPPRKGSSQSRLNGARASRSCSTTGSSTSSCRRKTSSDRDPGVTRSPTWSWGASTRPFSRRRPASGPISWATPCGSSPATRYASRSPDGRGTT